MTSRRTRRPRCRTAEKRSITFKKRTDFEHAIIPETRAAINEKTQGSAATYLRRGGMFNNDFITFAKEVMLSSLFVYLSVCLLATSERICMKFSGKVGNGGNERMIPLRTQAAR